MAFTKYLQSKPWILIIILISISSFRPSPHYYHSPFHMPWAEAGLTKKQAAAHLLDRFTFGAHKEDPDRLAKMGLEEWFLAQLKGNLPNEELDKRLAQYDALALSNEQVLSIFPRPARLFKEAVEAGFLKKDEFLPDKKSPETRQAIKAYMDSKNYRPQQELFRQFINQKILRAAYSNNQLQEILTDFWFNHFNVSLTKNECAPYIPSFERDVIRPNATGKFFNLLLATARSPAMLLYLDNFSSMGQNEQMLEQKRMAEERMHRKIGSLDPESPLAKQLQKREDRLKNEGLNENYAREIMELHTMGVDGGYTQNDVTEAARVLTGWTIFPANQEGPGRVIRKMFDQSGEDRLTAKGFLHDGDFLFAMNRHDTKEKTVLGKTFRQGGGYEEGVALIRLLADHQSTATFICKKLAVRFVCDEPPSALIVRMAKTFRTSDGDIQEVLKTMVASPEFWAKGSVREKTRSPFELAIASIRILNADVKAPFMIYNYIKKMGQNLYHYQAPTGFPDKGSYWINAGSLISRMNFGMDMAAQKIPGVHLDLAALNDHHEPESSEDALKTYAYLILPGRDMEPTLNRLKPLVMDPSIQQKINDAAASSPVQENIQIVDDMFEEEVTEKKKHRPAAPVTEDQQIMQDENKLLAQVVGIIIGSPEFQRK